MSNTDDTDRQLGEPKEHEDPTHKGEPGSLGEPGEPGPDSTIPDSDTGIAVGYTGEPSTMEPEEDPDHPSDDKTIES